MGQKSSERAKNDPEGPKILLIVTGKVLAALIKCNTCQKYSRTVLERVRDEPRKVLTVPMQVPFAAEKFCEGGGRSQTCPDGF